MKRYSYSDILQAARLCCSRSSKRNGGLCTNNDCPLFNETRCEPVLKNGLANINEFLDAVTNLVIKEVNAEWKKTDSDIFSKPSTESN
jgi:hypothetical protein